MNKIHPTANFFPQFEKKSEKTTSQNIRGEVLKEIGELSCVFYLYYFFNDKGWSVYRNYDEKGYDILLFNEKIGQKRKIEVKTRQRLINAPSNKNNTTHFTLTELQKDEADFLIAFWIEHNMFFIVPTSKITKFTPKSKNYTFRVKLDKNNKLNEEAENYRNWDIIIKKNASKR